MQTATSERIDFPASDPEDQRRAQGLDLGLGLLVELARIASYRGRLHEGLAQKHAFDRPKRMREVVMSSVKEWKVPT